MTWCPTWPRWCSRPWRKKVPFPQAERPAKYPHTGRRERGRAGHRRHRRAWSPLSCAAAIAASTAAGSRPAPQNRRGRCEGRPARRPGRRAWRCNMYAGGSWLRRSYHQGLLRRGRPRLLSDLALPISGCGDRRRAGRSGALGCETRRDGSLSLAWHSKVWGGSTTMPDGSVRRLVAWVTGASRGMGADNGDPAGLCRLRCWRSRRGDGLRLLTRWLATSRGARRRGVAFRIPRLTDRASVSAFADAALERFGGCDALWATSGSTKGRAAVSCSWIPPWMSWRSALRRMWWPRRCCVSERSHR